MWLRTQTRGYVNSDQLLSIGTGKDGNSRAIVVASLPAGGMIATAPLAGPFLDEARALEVCTAIVQRVAKGARAEVWDPAEAGR